MNNTLLADPNAIRLDKIVAEPESLTLVVMATRRSAECPRCGASSKRVHSRYVRTVADLPCSGLAVRLRLGTRRFRCANSLCPQYIFCERLPSIVARYARRTSRLNSALVLIGFALGGRPGARLASQLAMRTSRHILLKLIRQASTQQAEPSAILGIDDWALRKGRTYGTILVDLEKHRVLDLLPDRTAETAAAWLASQAGIQVVSRDRATAYAEAATRALPQATQIADRWHLLKNTTEMLDRVLQRHGRKVREASKAVFDEWTGSLMVAAATPEATPNLTREEKLKQQHRERRLARYEEVMALYQQGVRLRAIARTLRLSRNTVTKYVRAGEFPERRPERRRPSMVDEFSTYLARRWAEGCRSSVQLWRELRERGYKGGHSGFWDYFRRWRPATDDQPSPLEGTRVHMRFGARRPPKTTAIGTRAAAWLLQQNEGELRPDQQRFIAHLHEQTPELAVATKMVARFRQIIRKRQVYQLDAWLSEAAESGITELRNFAQALRRDYAAVKAALEHGWSNGQVEGQINRLKNIKRQMFGRAKFDLLRARVLHT